MLSRSLATEGQSAYLAYDIATRSLSGPPAAIVTAEVEQILCQGVLSLASRLRALARLRVMRLIIARRGIRLSPKRGVSGGRLTSLDCNQALVRTHNLYYVN